MSRQTREKLIEAGAIVPAAPGAVEPEATDVVTARVYRHPALGERPVVQLVPETLGPAEDLALEFLGFELSQPPVPVGTGRRQALGFPAWALINDPENGHHALALVKDMERLARQAKSRPGAARDGFDELARRLGASVPHFLPTFYEQAGRAFVAAENKQSAAIMFGKAREAERMHALPIDETRQRDVFLEFAFSGALNAKSLTQYAKDLAQRTDPVAAYELFRQVCAERVAGGLPPYTGMADDLRRLVRAAKLNQAAEEEQAIAQLLDSPALPHAPLPFWKSYAPALKRLSKKDPAIRGRLLGLLPRNNQGETEEFWFGLLHDCGALAGLTEVEGQPEAARPHDGSSGWLSRVVAWRSQGWRGHRRSAQVLELVRRMAPQLKAENRPLALLGHGADLDLLDLVLSLGLRVELPEGRPVPHFALGRWQSDTSPGRRDLACLAEAGWAQEPLRLGLRDALAGRRGYQQTEDTRIPLADLRVFYETRGTRPLLESWLDEAAQETAEGGLPALIDALDRMRPVWHGEVFGVRPQARDEVAGADVAAALAGTLRIGLVDELGWPALEEAVAEFPVPKPHPNGWTEPAFSVTEAWPALILHNKVMAVVVGPSEVLLRHTFRLPPGTSTPWRWQVAYTDGQLRVLWEGPDGTAGYWSNRPGEVFTVPGSLYYEHIGRFGTSLPLPEGGRTAGGRPLVGGDRALAKSREVATDGSGWWRLEEGAQGRSWREFDPATGDGGRRSRPAFFEAGLQGEGAELVEGWCVLAPLQPGLEATPFGTSDGLLGWRSVRLADGSCEAVSAGGDSARLSPALIGAARGRPGPAAVGPIRMPGGGEPAALMPDGHGHGLAFTDGSVRGSRVFTANFTSAGSEYAKGTAYVPPLAFWHALRPRDEKGSAALRSITVEQARALLDAARRGKAEKAVRKVLPQITGERLALGVAGVVELALAQVERLEALPRPVNTAVVETASPPPAATEIGEKGELPAAPAPVGVQVPSSVPDTDLRRAFGGLTTHRSYYWGSHHNSGESAIASLRGVVETLAGQPRKGLLAKLGVGAKKLAGLESGVAQTSVDWTLAVGGLGALALRAALVTTAVEDRPALAALLAAIAETPLAEADGRWRRLTLTVEKTTTPQGAREGLAPFGTLLPTKGGQAFVISSDSEWFAGGYRGVIHAVEHVSEPGDFGPVKGYGISASREGRGWGGAGRLNELLALLAERGPAPWRPEAVEELAQATGVTRAEAALLLAGLVRIDVYENNFLPKPLRELLGLKVAEAKTARDSLSRLLSTDARLHLLSLAMPDSPADLWQKGPDVARLADGWNELFGRRVPVPDALVADFSAARKSAWTGAKDPAAVLQGMVGPESTPWLTTDLRFTVRDNQLVQEPEESDTDAGFRAKHLADTVIALLWLAYRLPLGDSVRAVLPRVYDLLQQRLANPDLLLTFLEGDGSRIEGLRQVYGLPPVSDGPNQPVEVVPLGEVGHLLSRGWNSAVFVCPAKLDAGGEPLLELARALPSYQSAPLLIARSGELARLIDEVRAEPTAGTELAWLQDPLVSVPELVAEVSQHHNLGTEAARLYLQLLALPDPTDKNVRTWNGWAPKVLKTATAALLEAGLVVEGKRARAGRSVFLPTAWLPVKAPGLPLEAWKVPLLGLQPDGSSPLHLAVPVTSVRELYRRAWERVLAGDEPRMAALETGRPGVRR
ncbi:hypothetical protein LWF15_26725 [Kineosporia rhizophila]|uniref:hypothetical protein n=1 Tax=Kineosporia rhizophila TaxID=84633 RepID=UPI001E52AF64|nr:hypothetical protein [Kineosporia rhizophila]MCE0539100.1 hypothetical protein [Kineosporia rhizophila]